MSEPPKGILNASQSSELFNVINLTLGEVFFSDIDEKISRIIQNVVVTDFLEKNQSSEECCSQFLKSLESLKILLELSLQHMTNSEFCLSSETVAGIVQFLRDVCDSRQNQQSSALIISILECLCRVCHLSQCDQNIHSLCNFYLYQMHLVQRNLDSGELLFRLDIVTILLKSVSSSKSISNIKKFEEKTKELNKSIEENRLIVNLLLYSEDAVCGKTLLNLLPLYVLIFTPDILQVIWNEAVMFNRDKDSDFRKFTVLCFVFDIISSDTSCDNLAKALEDEKFWNALQYGLIQRDHMIRRQALYLLKRCVQEIYDRNLSITSKKFDELSGTNFKHKLDEGVIRLTNGLKNFSISNNKIFLLQLGVESVMWWNENLNNELNTLFTDIFLIIETLEEKQVHIVKPVYNTMLRVVDAALVPFRNGKCLHASWVLVLYDRFLHHDNADVVRWGLCNLMDIDISVIHQENLMSHFIHLLVTSWNNAAVIIDQRGEVRNSIATFFTKVASTSVGKLFFQNLIDEISSAKWNPESLFVILYALGSINEHCWKGEHLLMLRDFIASSFTNYYTFLRSAIQCQLLQVIVNLSDISDLSLRALCKVLGAFRKEECLQRGCDSWKLITNWVEFCYSKLSAEEFIAESVTKLSDEKPSNVARMLCILYDAHLFGVMRCCGETPSPKIMNILSKLLAAFKDFDKRLYSNTDDLVYNLKILQCILAENLDVAKPENSHLVEMVLPYVGDIFAFAIARCQNLSGFEESTDHITSIKLILEAQKLYRINSEAYTNSLFQFCFATLGIGGISRSSSLEKCVAMNILRLILDYVYFEKSIPNLKIIQAYFKANINVPLPKEEQSRNWGRINNEYLTAQWYIVHRLKNENLLTLSKTVKVEIFFSNEELASHCASALQLGTSSVLVPIMRVAEELLPELEPLIVEKLLVNCWHAVVETRRSEAFKVCVNQFIRMLFQQAIVIKALLDKCLVEYSTTLLSEDMNGIAKLFVTHIQTLQVKYSSSIIWADILARSAVFGPLVQREDRGIIEVCRIVSDSDNSANDLVENDWCTGPEVRARAIQIILTLNSGAHAATVDAIADALVNRELSATGNKTRYFGGSSIHFIRTRIIQTLLVLEPMLTMMKRKDLYNWLCTFIIRQSHQPSVRYLAEWLIVRLLWRVPELQESIWANFNEAVEQRTGSLCSFISIVYHTLFVLPSTVLQDWLDRAVTQFMPYCLAQHFSLRLYAQVTLEKLWELAEQHQFTGFLEKYSVLRRCLSRTIGNGNALRNIDKLRQDFYWTSFHPLHHYSLQTIFRDLPRLAHVTADEWIAPELFTKVGVPSKLQTISLTSGEDLWHHPLSEWTSRSDDDVIEVNTDNVQKKMIPIKSLMPDYHQLLGMTDYARRKEVPTGGLIVVASLIDKTANLGGLSRTCEAFGVSELVIDSLQLLEDKNFQSLSVTSEKWLNMTEVKTHYLPDYILRMKREGYTVVGAEQTSRSKLLHQTNLPKKSLLLLGNEKEGLPIQLIPLLDECVEVPQLGVIRSLNVHVTASLFIWEYAKQHPLA